MKKLLTILLGLSFPGVVSATGSSTITSPDGSLKALVGDKDGIPTLTVSANGTEMYVATLGLKTSAGDFSSGLELVSSTNPEEFTESYNLLHGKHSSVSHTGNKLSVSFRNSDNETLGLEIKAFNDGVAFRYILPDMEGQTITFNDEATAYAIPSSADRWLQKYVTSYEGDFPHQAGAAGSGEWGYPSLFEVDGKFMLISEANTSRMYCATHLDNSEEPDVYKVVYPGQNEGNGIGSVYPEWSGEWMSPWRVTIIGSLKNIVESTLIEDVSDPCRLAYTSWVLPGRAAWVYWAYNHGTKDFQICKQYVDLAVAMGWEYVLFDWEWDQMSNGGNLADAVAYARNNGIKPLLWYNSGGPHTGVGSTPRDCMLTHESRVKEFTKLKEMGVAGVKVDFFESDKQQMMQYFIDILEDAADFGILVNFHGCTLPRGWHRTYPHLMSYEAVYGAEQYNNSSYMTSEGPRINCLLPYTRNVVGPMDYTPVAFTNSQNAHTTTYAHELALSVAFESGIQHWADRPEGFNALPEVAKNHMKTVPAAWDETVFVDGYPGKSFVVARRSGDTWYVAGLTGENKSRNFNLDFDFLEPGKTYSASVISDGSTPTAFGFRHETVAAGDGLEVLCQAKGGFVIILAGSEDVTMEQVRMLVAQSQEAIATAEGNLGLTTGKYDTAVVDALKLAVSVAVEAMSQADGHALAEAYTDLLDAYSNFQSNGFIRAGAVPNKHLTQNVTLRYLGDARNFSRSDTDMGASTRFGLLGEPWVVSRGIINQDNFMHGGFDSFEGGKYISIEKYDAGLPAIENGHIYQTTNKELPAGEYSVKLYVTSNYGFGTGECMFNTYAGSVFGGDATPMSTYDIKTRDGWVWDWVAAGNFVLTVDTKVSLGFLVNIPAGNDGRSVRISDIRLYDKNGTDITENYMSNYREYTRKDLSPLRFGEPAQWQVNNFVIPNGDDGIKKGIDRYPGYNCLTLGVWDDSDKAEGDLSETAIYKTVKLPAGRYFFGNSYYNIWDIRKAYLFVSDCGVLPVSEVEQKALAFQPVTDAGAGDAWDGVTFETDKECEVTLGWCADLSTYGQQEFRVKEVALLRYLEREGEWLLSEAPRITDELTVSATECAEQYSASNTFSTEGEGLLNVKAGEEVFVGHINLSGIKGVTVNAETRFPVEETSAVDLLVDGELWDSLPFIADESEPFAAHVFTSLAPKDGIHALSVRFPDINANLRSVKFEGSESSGVEMVTAEDSGIASATEYYDLMGRKMNTNNLPRGIYIRRCDSVAEKIIVH